jgi:hypothetical protein
LLPPTSLWEIRSWRQSTTSRWTRLCDHRSNNTFLLGACFLWQRDIERVLIVGVLPQSRMMSQISDHV